MEKILDSWFMAVAIIVIECLILLALAMVAFGAGNFYTDIKDTMTDYSYVQCYEPTEIGQ